MLLRKIFVSFTSAANYWFKGTFAYVNTAAGRLDICEGHQILSSDSGASVLITCNNAHGLNVGDPVRVIGHMNAVSPSPVPLIDPDTLYVVVTVPSVSSLTINVTTADNGVGGYVGRPTLDHIDLSTLAMVAVSQITDFVPGEDRVG